MKYNRDIDRYYILWKKNSGLAVVVLKQYFIGLKIDLYTVFCGGKNCRVCCKMRIKLASIAMVISTSIHSDNRAAIDTNLWLISASKNNLNILNGYMIICYATNVSRPTTGSPAKLSGVSEC
jgi:hypothetical protein